MTTLLFTICNSLVLLAWFALLLFPKHRLTERLMEYPWLPLGVSVVYLYFIIVSGGLLEADFSKLEGIVSLFQRATPESAAAGWLHYLAFDFWVGVWMIKHSRKFKISHKILLLPLLLTFMLGPTGILAYSLILLARKLSTPASESERFALDQDEANELPGS